MSGDLPPLVAHHGRASPRFPGLLAIVSPQSCPTHHCLSSEALAVHKWQTADMQLLVILDDRPKEVK